MNNLLKFITAAIFAAALALTACSGNGDDPENPDTGDDTGNPETITQYTVTFDSQGGSAVASQTIDAGGKITEPADPERDADIFSGWYKEVSCANAWVFSGDTVNGDMTLYAKWIRPAGYKETFTVDSVSFNMISVLGKTFPTGVDDNGDIDGDGNQDIPPTATVSNAYWIAETEVTYELWYTVYQWAIANDYTFVNKGTEGDNGTAGEAPTEAKNEPVTGVDWRDSMVFCNAVTEWCNAKNGTSLACVYKDSGTPIRDSTDAEACDAVTPDIDASGFRLPAGSEWELAARWQDDSTNSVSGYSDPWFTKGDSASGDSGPYDSSTTIGDYAWYNVNSGVHTQDVGGKLANDLGIYDMSGNVDEWCFDLSGTNRMIRGGYFSGGASDLQVGCYTFGFPDGPNSNFGFRLSRTQ